MKKRTESGDCFEIVLVIIVVVLAILIIGISLIRSHKTKVEINRPLTELLNSK